MKRILYLATYNITRRSGGGLACLAYYNAFKKLFPEQVDLAMAKEYCLGEYESAIKIPARNCLIKGLTLFRGEIHRNKVFFKQFVKQVAGQYSYCVINGGIYAGDMIDLFHRQGIKVIVIHHNFEREYQLDNKTIDTFYGLNPYLVIRNERNAYLKSDVNCFLTSADIDLFHKYYGFSAAKEYLFGTFEPVFSELASFDIKTKNKNIVITGSMNAYQTIDGIMDFKNNYFPIILNELKDWNIILSGRDPSTDIYQFENDNFDRIKVIANPSNIDDVINMGSIFLCPTRIGGGLKLRIMDGLRRGLPVITHKVSARGYDMFFDSPFFKIYDDEDSFRKSLISLVDFVNENEGYQQEIVNMYNSVFGFDAGCIRLKCLMDSLENN